MCTLDPFASFCRQRREGRLLRVSYSHLHLIIILFCAALRRICSLLTILSRLLEFSADQFDHGLFPDFSPPLLPCAPIIIEPVTVASVSTGVYKYPPSLLLKNLIPIDLVTYIHINTIRSLLPALCCFHRWSSTVSTSWFPHRSISLRL